MNKFKILLGCLLLFLLCSCSENEAPVYSSSDDGLYFVSDKDIDVPMAQPLTSFSFSDISSYGKSIDTTQLLVRVSGAMKDFDRSFNVVVVEDSITTADASMYNILDCVVPAGSIFGEVNIEVNKTDALEDERFYLELAIVESEDFPNVDMATNNGFLEITSLPIKPSNWDNYLTYWFGTYSNKWLQFIIDYTHDTNLGYKYYKYQETIDNELLFYRSTPYVTINYTFFEMMKTEDGGNAGDLNLNRYMKELAIELELYLAEHGEPLTHDDGTVVEIPSI